MLLRTAHIGLVLLCLGVVGAVLPSAEAANYLLGYPWEQPVLDGIKTQDRELKRMSPAALVGQYQRMAARRAGNDEMIKRQYLLGRAHGKNFESLRRAALEARNAGQKQAVLDNAEAARRLAVRAYLESIRLSQDRCYFAYHDVAVLELQRAQSNAAQAVAYLRRSHQINPRYPGPLRKLALVYREAKQYGDVIIVLRKLLRLEPRDIVAKTTLAAALAETNRIAESRQIVAELLRADPENVGYRTLGANLDLKEGKLDAAQATFRRLAESSPTNPLPLEGFLRCLEEKRKKKLPPDPDDYIWAMNRMYRLERRKDVREKLLAQIENLKKQKAEQAGVKNDGKPPSAEDLAAWMKGSDEARRYKIVSFLNAVNQPPPKALLDAIMSRLSAKSEPSARIRAVAVEIAGRQLGWGWMPIARLVTAQDPDARVRAAGIDAIIRMADQGATARAAAILTAGLFLEDRDRSVAATARLGILALGSGRLRIEDDAPDHEHRAAFRTWWDGAQGEDLQIESLRRYPELKDPFVDDVLRAYAQKSSFFIRQAAYEACVAVRDLIATPQGRAWYQGKRRAGYPAFERWFASLPVAPGGRLTRENAAQVEPLITRWWSARPK